MEDQQHPLHFKIKRNIMNKFLSEPVDALDLRLTKAEALLDGSLVDDPWKVKSERDEEGDRGSVITVSDEREHEDEPLDFSDTQDSHDDRVTSSRDDLEGQSDTEDDHPDKDVQFIRASSLKSFRNQLIIRSHHHHHPQVKSRSSPEPLSSYPRILPSLSTSRPASCLSPHSTYQDHQHRKDQGFPSIRHPDYDSSSRLCWPQNDHQDSFGIKKERTVEETEYIDKKILMAERFFANSANPLSSSYEEDRTCGSPQHQDPHNRIPPTRRHDLPVGPSPSSQYLARTYELLNMNRSRETDLSEPRKDFPRNVRTDSVIVRNSSSPHVRRQQGEGALMSAEGHYHPYRRLQSSLSLSSDHQDWLDNLQRLRERIASQIQEQKLAVEQQSMGEYQQRHPPYVSYSPLIPNYLPPIKAEPGEPVEVIRKPTSKSSIPEDHDTRVSSMFLHPPTKASWFGYRTPSPAASERKPSVSSHGHHVLGHVYPPPSQTRDYLDTCFYSAGEGFFSDQASRAKRGRPRKHAPKVPLPPLYVFIRNLLHNVTYNPSVISWVDEVAGCFKINNTVEFAATWGRMKSNRSEEMNYEKMSRAMRYHYGSVRQGRKGHLAMVKEKRLFYRFGELAVNWKTEEMRGKVVPCCAHRICSSSLCLWTKE